MSRAARLGAFIIATLGILVAGIFIIGDRQYLFASTYRLKTQFSTVAGLDAGAEVRVGGVLSGSVRGIELPNKPTDKITVLMDLQRSTHDIVKQDSIASIQTEGLLGNQFVSISFGSAQGSNVRDGDTIVSQPPLVIADLISKTDAILDSSQAVLRNVNGASANLNSITTKIEQGQGTIGALINDKTMYTQLDQTTAGMRDTMAHAFLRPARACRHLPRPNLGQERKPNRHRSCSRGDSDDDLVLRLRRLRTAEQQNHRETTHLVGLIVLGGRFSQPLKK